MSKLHGTCGKTHYHLAMVVVEIETFFVERGAVEKEGAEKKKRGRKRGKKRERCEGTQRNIMGFR